MLMTSMSSVGFTVLTFLSGVIIARLLGIEGRGQYGAVMFWAQFAMLFCAFSFREGATVSLRSDERSALQLLPTLLATASLLFLGAAIIVAGAYQFGVMRIDGVDGSLIVPFVIACCAVALLSRSFISIEAAQLNFATINQDRLLAPGLFCLALVFIMASGIHMLSWVLWAFIAGKLPVLCLWVWRYRARLFGRIDRLFAGQILKLGFKYHAAATLTLVSQQIDRLILVAIWPTQQLGLYFVAFSAAGAGVTMVSQAIGLTLLPSLAGTEQAERRDKLERIFRYTLIAAAGFALAVIVTAPIIIPLVFGTEFRAAVPYTQGLAIALALMPVRAVVLEANRSIQLGRPGIEMAIASLAVFLAIFAVTRFAVPWHLFIAIGASHMAAIIAGLRFPVARGDFRLAHGLIPRPADAVFLVREVVGHLPRAR